MKQMTPAKLLLLLLLTYTVSGKAENDLGFFRKKSAPTLKDTVKINELYDCFLQFRATEPARAKGCLKQSIALAEALDLPQQKMLLYNDMGTFYDINGMADSAFHFLHLSLELAQLHNDQERIGMAYKNIGIVYYDIADYANAMSNFVTSLKIHEKNNNQKGIADAYIWMGIVNEFGLQKYRKALDYHRQALAIYEQLNADERKAYSYNNIGNCYNKLQMPDSAIYYFNRSLEIKIKRKDSISIGNTYNNIGTVYYDNGQYRKSLEYYQQSLAYRIKANDLSGIASCHINIGNVYLQLKDYGKALESHTEARRICEQIAYNDGLMAALDGLATTFAAKGDFQNAYTTRLEHEHIKDSVFNIQSVQQMEELQVQYDTEKKENQIVQQKLKLSRRNLMIGALSAIFLLSLLTFYLIYNRYKLRQERRLQEELLKEEEKRTRAMLETEENERQRLARELHDGVGQLLTASRLMLNPLYTNAQTPEENKQQIKQTIDILDDSILEIRNISHNMVPDILQKYGLEKAIRHFTDRIRQMRKIDIQVESHELDESKLDGTSQLMLYRIVQEAVNNALKYAEAGRIHIQLTADENELSVMIEDNGKGFDVNQIKEKGGIGMRNLQLRTEYLKGHLSIDSSPKSGTTIIVEIPLS